MGEREHHPGITRKIPDFRLFPLDVLTSRIPFLLYTALTPLCIFWSDKRLKSQTKGTVVALNNTIADTKFQGFGYTGSRVYGLGIVSPRRFPTFFVFWKCVKMSDPTRKNVGFRHFHTFSKHKKSGKMARWNVPLITTEIRGIIEWLQQLACNQQLIELNSCWEAATCSSVKRAANASQAKHICLNTRRLTPEMYKNYSSSCVTRHLHNQMTWRHMRVHETNHSDAKSVTRASYL